MDPRSSTAKSVLVLGSVLTILGVGTWALVAGATLAFSSPALFGAGFLLIGVVLLKARYWHRHLLWLSVLIALAIIAVGLDAILEALRFTDGVPISPEAMQQAIAVLLCGAFVIVSARRLVSPQVP